MAIELTDELIELETMAWEQQQAGALTFEAAAAVHAAVAAYTAATGQPRYEIEMVLKKRVRNPDPPVDAAE